MSEGDGERRIATIAKKSAPRDARRMLELYLIRHGQTDFSRENRFCGSIDPPLNEIGLRMAEAFGASYASKSWDGIYTSPSQRARKTAAPLAERVKIEPVVDEGLKEIG